MIAKVEEPVPQAVDVKGGPLYPDYLRKYTLPISSARSKLDPSCRLCSIVLTQPAHYDPLEKVEPVGRFEHDDPGHRADPAMPNLLPPGTETNELSPHCGTEILGVQIVRASQHPSPYPQVQALT
jgi:sulfonate dioxygenase